MTQMDFLTTMANVLVTEVTESETSTTDESYEATIVLDVVHGKRPISYIIDKTFLEESISLVLSAPPLPEPEQPMRPKSRIGKLGNKIKGLFAKKKRVVRYSLR